LTTAEEIALQGCAVIIYTWGGVNSQNWKHLKYIYQ
jgi:hypothetical protein